MAIFPSSAVSTPEAVRRRRAEGDSRSSKRVRFDDAPAECPDDETAVDNHEEVIAGLLAAIAADGGIPDAPVDVSPADGAVGVPPLLDPVDAAPEALLRVPTRDLRQSASDGSTVATACEEFGFHMGLAFQIQDDILDFTAAADILGKPALADMCLVGVQGYMQLYHHLAVRLDIERHP